MIHETGEEQQSIEDSPKITTSKFHRQEAAQSSLCRYEGLYHATKTEILRGCKIKKTDEEKGAE